jgi:hypothetical protein
MAASTTGSGNPSQAGGDLMVEVEGAVADCDEAGTACFISTAAGLRIVPWRYMRHTKMGFGVHTDS